MLNAAPFNAIAFNAMTANGGDMLLSERGTSSDIASNIYVIIGGLLDPYWMSTDIIDTTKTLDSTKTYDNTLDTSIFFQDFFGAIEPVNSLPDSGAGLDLITEIALVLSPIFDSGISVDTIINLLSSLNIVDLGTGLENISLLQFVNVLRILSYMKQNLNINTNQKINLNLNTNMPNY